jgi:hypothetical protein
MRSREVALGAQEAITLVTQVQEPPDRYQLAGVLGL